MNNRKRNKARAASPLGVTPITINNHFPEQLYTISSTHLEDGTAPLDSITSSGCTKSPLIISRQLDAAVRRYAE